MLCSAKSLSAQKKLRLGNSSEYIISLARTTTNMGPSVDPVLRFSMWFNTGVVVEQKITNHVALVSGLNLRNVGLINKIDSIKLKQRVYSTGVPLAIRFGDLNKKVNVTLGAEAEFFLNYKVKEFVFDEKIYKSNEWLSDNVELFNPSVFAQFQFGNSLYIRFKYYLNNFLKECANQTGTVNTCGYTLHNSAKTTISGYPLNTQLFYMSFGTERFDKNKKKKPNNTSPTPKRTPTRSI